MIRVVAEIFQLSFEQFSMAIMSNKCNLQCYELIVSIKHSFAVAYSDMWEIYGTTQANKTTVALLWYDDKGTRAMCSFNEFLMMHFSCNWDCFKHHL